MPFILMPYPIFKDATGRDFHFIGRDKVDLGNTDRVSDGGKFVKNAQSQRRRLALPSRRWNIAWKNNG